MSPPNLQPQVDRYQPTSRRHRLVIIAVTVATVVGLWGLLLFRPGTHPRTFPSPTVPRCAAGQTSGCVGGKADVMLLPAPADSPPGGIAPAATASSSSVAAGSSMAAASIAASAVATPAAALPSASAAR